MDATVFYCLKQMPFEKETKYKTPFESEDVRNMTGRLEYLKKVRGIGCSQAVPVPERRAPSVLLPVH